MADIESAMQGSLLRVHLSAKLALDIVIQMFNQMSKIRLDDRAESPLYKQIVEQIQQLIAIRNLLPGDHLPTVRQLAQELRINPGTVAKAYRELEQQGVVTSRRGGGTIVSANAGDPQVSMLRQTRLSNLMSGSILETLSMGYSPEEIEAAFSLHLARWREERRVAEESMGRPRDKSTDGNSLLIVGSDDLALDLLVGQLKQRDPEISIEVIHAGSLGGLVALQEERADLAGIHLLDEETGEYNYPYVKHLLPGRKVAIVHLAYRVQGLIVPGGNPKGIKGLEDLTNSDITIVNRQKGSGTRVLLDFELRKRGIVSSEIKGYQREVDTHLAVATSIARGEADVGLGIEAAARSCGLDFMPLFRERYDLVIPADKYRSKRLSPLLQIIASEDFRTVVTSVGGYDTSQTGATTFL